MAAAITPSVLLQLQEVICDVLGTADPELDDDSRERTVAECLKQIHQALRDDLQPYADDVQVLKAAAAITTALALRTLRIFNIEANSTQDAYKQLIIAAGLYRRDDVNVKMHVEDRGPGAPMWALMTFETCSPDKIDTARERLESTGVSVDGIAYAPCRSSRRAAMAELINLLEGTMEPCDALWIEVAFASRLHKKRAAAEPSPAAPPTPPTLADADSVARSQSRSASESTAPGIARESTQSANLTSPRQLLVPAAPAVPEPDATVEVHPSEPVKVATAATPASTTYSGAAAAELAWLPLAGVRATSAFSDDAPSREDVADAWVCEMKTKMNVRLDNIRRGASKRWTKIKDNVNSAEIYTGYEYSSSDCLGVGSQGKVYLARWRPPAETPAPAPHWLPEFLAVKIIEIQLPPGVDDAAVAKESHRQLTELKIHKQLEPHASASADRKFVRLYDYAIMLDHRITLYLVMELCLGTLLDRMACCTTIPLTEREEYYICRRTALALHHMHVEAEPHILHRDLRPSNVFFAYEDASVLVGDFGLSRALADGVHDGTRTEMVLLSTMLPSSSREQSLAPPEYYCPAPQTAGAVEDGDDSDHDRARHDGIRVGAAAAAAIAASNHFALTRAADVWMLGQIFFYVFSHGRLPFVPAETPPADAGKAHKEQVCARRKACMEHLRDDTPPSIVGLIHWMLSWDRKQRPTTVWIIGHPAFWSMSTLTLRITQLNSESMGNRSARRVLAGIADDRDVWVPRHFVRSDAVVQHEWCSPADAATQCKQALILPSPLCDRFKSYSSDAPGILRFIRNYLHHVADYTGAVDAVTRTAALTHPVVRGAQWDDMRELVVRHPEVGWLWHAFYMALWDRMAAAVAITHVGRFAPPLESASVRNSLTSFVRSLTDAGVVTESASLLDEDNGRAASMQDIASDTASCAQEDGRGHRDGGAAGAINESLVLPHSSPSLLIAAGLYNVDEDVMSALERAGGWLAPLAAVLLFGRRDSVEVALYRSSILLHALWERTPAATGSSPPAASSPLAVLEVLRSVPVICEGTAAVATGNKAAAQHVCDVLQIVSHSTSVTLVVLSASFDVMVLVPAGPVASARSDSAVSNGVTLVAVSVTPVVQVRPLLRISAADSGSVEGHLPQHVRRGDVSRPHTCHELGQIAAGCVRVPRRWVTLCVPIVKKKRISAP